MKDEVSQVRSRAEGILGRQDSVGKGMEVRSSMCGGEQASAGHKEPTDGGKQGETWSGLHNGKIPPAAYTSGSELCSSVSEVPVAPEMSGAIC